MVSEKGSVAVCEAESVTVMVNDETPGDVGTPEMTPVELRVSRGGSEPEVSCHAYGDTPPAAVRVCEYGVPATPEGRGEAEEMARGGRTILSPNTSFAPAEFASTTAATNRAAPAAVGVPEITPAEEIERPSGSEPAATDQVYGGDPPVAASACEYGSPT